jgi:uncharacterized Zn finger protein
MVPPRRYGAGPVAARPLATGDGLPACAPEAEVGRTWWSRRFLNLLESFGIGTRLERGREYARTGQVVGLEVEPGIALAQVQGSRFTPYRVRIRPAAFSEHQWRRAERAIAARALTLARLLAGEMPSDIEEVLAGAKLALLPSSYAELRASCTCPDEANPCKHTAAAYYVLAERFDDDPFALFTLRGRMKDELLHSLRARRTKAVGKLPAAAVANVVEDTRPEAPPALAEVLERFWSAGPELGALEVSPLASEFPDALLRRLGPLGLQQGDCDLGELLAPAYARLAAAAERRALSGW